MRIPTTAATAVLALALLLGAAGCGSDTADTTPTASDPASTTAAPTTSTPTASEPSTTSSPAEPEGGGPFQIEPADGGSGSGNGLGLTDVGVGSHDGFDRIVFDLGGEGTPGWHVEWVKDPTADGSGDPVQLEGDAFLQVVLHGMGLPYDTGIEPFGDDKTRVPGAGGITEVAPGGVFEGDQLAYAGVTGGERPFRVSVLSNPTRLVVDVQTP